MAAKELKGDDLIRHVMDLVDYGRRGIKATCVLDRRDKSIQYHLGNHKIKLRPERLGNKVWNKYGQIKHSRIAHIIAQNPKWKFLPRQETGTYGADALNSVMTDYLWDKIGWDLKGENSVNESFDAGSAHAKLFLNKDTGWPDAAPLTAKEYIPDPKAKKISELRFWGHVYPMDTAEIEEEYGVKVAPDVELEGTSHIHDVQISYQVTAGVDEAPLSAWRDSSILGDSKYLPDHIGRAMVFEMYWEDKTMEAIPYTDDETDSEHRGFVQNIVQKIHPGQNHPKHIAAHIAFLKTLDPESEPDKEVILAMKDHIDAHSRRPQKTKKRKYPYGRLTIIASNKVLKDEPNPWGETDTPLDFRELIKKWDYEIVSDSYWGKGGGADLFDPQDALNHRKNAITQMINRMNNGIKTMRTRSYNVLRGALKKAGNLIGVTIPVKEHDDFMINFGPPFPPQVFQDEYHTEEFMDMLGHHTDIMSGQFPKGSPAGVTVSQLHGEGMKPINHIVKHYALFLQDMARTLLVMMIETVHPNTLFRIVDDKNNFQFVKWDELKQDAGRYDVHIDVQSMITTSRRELLEEAIMLYRETVVDRRHVLNKIDDPDKYETMKRMDEIMMLATENQALKEELKDQIGEVDRLNQNLRAIEQKEGGKDDKDKKAK